MILHDIDGYSSADRSALLKRYLLNFFLWICSTLCCMPAAFRLSFAKDPKRVAGNPWNSWLSVCFILQKLPMAKKKLLCLCMYHTLSFFGLWQIGKTSSWDTLTDSPHRNTAPANAIVDWRAGHALLYCSIPQEFFETRQHLSHLARDETTWSSLWKTSTLRWRSSLWPWKKLLVVVWK